MFVASIVVSAVLAAVFGFSGVRKIPGTTVAATEAEHLHCRCRGIG